MTPQETYQELLARAREIALIGSTNAVLGWDQEVNMPPKGAEWRAQQSAYLSGLAHRKATEHQIGELLAVLEASDLVQDPLSDEAVNIREWRHSYDREIKLPTDFVEKYSHTASLAQNVWAQARAANDFSLYAPKLAELIELTKQKADYIGYDDKPYDALLDEFEPGEKTENVKRLFAGLRDELVPFLQAILASPHQPDASIIEDRDYPIERQRILGEMASVAFGLDYASARLDVSTHPFSTNFGPGDQRITTRYRARNLGDSLFGTMHETGHALYEQNMPAAFFGMPRGSAVSLGIHESQSRTWENLVGRSKAFWQHFFPITRQLFPQALADVSLEDFYFAINAVKPGFIRVDADEVTYNLHIMLRFEIEQAIINENLPVDDIPARWNALFKAYLGLDVPSDTLGVLQDIHWSFGAMGYFPTYALGNLYSAQFFARARHDLPDLDASFARGDFSPLLDWLRQNIHQHGQRYRAADLAQVVTGSPLDYKPFMAYLREKYTPLYQLDASSSTPS
jgi:carboxypeptidase Taq